jgi:hypothetical protein
MAAGDRSARVASLTRGLEALRKDSAGAGAGRRTQNGTEQATELSWSTTLRSRATAGRRDRGTFFVAFAILLAIGLSISLTFLPAGTPSNLNPQPPVHMIGLIPLLIATFVFAGAVLWRFR